MNVANAKGLFTSVHFCKHRSIFSNSDQPRNTKIHLKFYNLEVKLNDVRNYLPFLSLKKKVNWSFTCKVTS